jgi:hypothetical protein
LPGISLSAQDENLSEKKSKIFAMQNLPAAIANANHPQNSNGLKIGNEWQSLVAYYQDFFDGGYICSPDNCSDSLNRRRKSNRLRINGIVALTSFEKPVVTRIYDIAPGGVSFLHTNEIYISDNEFKMDILIFDNLTDFEYLINQAHGRVKSRNLVSDPKNKAPIWRFSVEFYKGVI